MWLKLENTILFQNYYFESFNTTSHAKFSRDYESLQNLRKIQTQ